MKSEPISILGEQVSALVSSCLCDLDEQELEQQVALVLPQVLV